MDNQVIRATQLAMPGIQGQVSVSLAELDKLRNDYVTAVRIAQDLEEKQGQVRFVIEEAYYQPPTDPIEYDRYGNLIKKHYKQNTSTRVVKESYLNLDEFREFFTLQERERVKKELDEKEDAITSAIKEVEAASKKINALKEDLRKANDENQELKTQMEVVGAENEKLKSESETASSNNANLIKENDNLRTRFENVSAELHKWKKAKSFWYSIWGNAEKI